MSRIRTRCFLARVLAIIAISQSAQAIPDEAADRITVAVDALTRLDEINLESSPPMKERVLKVLEKTRGTPNFVRLVRHFHLTGQETGLVEVAAVLPTDENAIEGLRLVLAGGQSPVIKAALQNTNETRAAGLAEALGNSNHHAAPEYLSPLANSPATPPSVRRQAIISLARSAPGAKSLLTLVHSGSLPDDLRSTALSELSQTRWPDIQAEAIRIKGQSVVKIKPITEMAKLSGDVTRGDLVFHRASPGCIQCHVVNGKGVELGPNLSEIGSKLPKEALYQAILEPSAGISFGFEAFTITLKDGDEAFGLIASETADELVLKAVGGVLTRYKKSEVVSRQKSALSIMPAGLEAGMTTQELVDLVEYLASLKKPN